jgi:ribonuclease-3
VVNEAVLAAAGERLEVGSYLYVGKGEEVTGGRQKASILSDVVEALLGALYLDAGYQRAAEVTLTLVGEEIDRQAHAPGGEDFKTRLQEVAAKRGQHPEYRVSGEGPDHDKIFHAEVIVEGRLVGSGSGGSKRAAEQAAAEKALFQIGS